MPISTIEARATDAKLEVQFETLETILPQAGENLRIATLSIRAAFSVADANIDDFIQLRRLITNDAMAYRSRILPVAKHSTTDVKQFMDYFISLPMDDIVEIKDELSADATTGFELMTICKDMHMEVCACFKQHQDKIDRVLATCRLEKERCEAQAKSFQDKAESQKGWATALAFVPGVNLIATPILLSHANSSYAEAEAATEEAQLAVNATFVIRDCLTGAVDEYVKTMDIFAATFQLLASEIAAFLNNLNKFTETEKKAFYMMCNRKAKTVAKACNVYLTFAIQAETDLMALPESDSENYVQQWLATHRVEGQKSFLERLAELKNLPKMLKNLTQ